MLIRCPECGEKISDKCVYCVHCGYPYRELSEVKSQKVNICIIDGIEFDLTKPYVMTMRFKKNQIGKVTDIIKEIVAITSIRNASDLYTEMFNSEKVPRRWMDVAPQKESTPAVVVQQPQVGVVTCPYCHSTNVKRIGRFGKEASIYFKGIASAKMAKQWHCNNCNSNF